MGRPVFFRQIRPGYRTKPFTLYKFRTMREGYRPDGTPLPDAERLTRLGRFLRKTSLDELPQLWNVLRGDLSLVGPRPLLMQYLPLYTPSRPDAMMLSRGLPAGPKSMAETRSVGRTSSHTMSGTWIIGRCGWT